MESTTYVHREGFEQRVREAREAWDVEARRLSEAEKVFKGIQAAESEAKRVWRAARQELYRYLGEPKRGEEGHDSEFCRCCCKGHPCGCGGNHV